MRCGTRYSPKKKASRITVPIAKTEPPILRFNRSLYMQATAPKNTVGNTWLTFEIKDEKAMYNRSRLRK
ncbi:MAG: hypothetical protein CHH17_12135 [Candidatus Fluviicola riflensis]|nr:MAG: hypothetical protein CHH17_12135 [Candidatus Fluviicola riflensis]